jgi:CheY-like chemotaxis protein
VLDPYTALQNAALNDKEPQQGMRLAISRQALESIGGHLRIDNGPDSPVSLSLVLPRAVALMDSQLPVMPRVLADDAVQVNTTTRGRVLYVEDNPSNVLLVREFLSLRPGVELIVAHNVAEGLAAVAAERFDFALLDLQLPDGDGYEVLQALRSLRHATPCVALTANAMINERNRALEAGFEAFWTKPLNLPEFLQGLDLWLSSGMRHRHRADA